MDEVHCILKGRGKVINVNASSEVLFVAGCTFFLLTFVELKHFFRVTPLVRWGPVTWGALLGVLKIAPRCSQNTDLILVSQTDSAVIDISCINDSGRKQFKSCRYSAIWMILGAVV